MMARVSRRARGFGGLSAGAGRGGRVWGRCAGGGCGVRVVLACGRLAGGWQGADRGQDGGQQVRAGRQPHDQLPAVADQPGGGGDQGPAQGGDHGLAAADPVACCQLAYGVPQPAYALAGLGFPRSSGGSSVVLVDQPADGGPAVDRGRHVDGLAWVMFRRVKGSASVRAMMVVVALELGKDGAQVPFAVDQQVIEALPA